MSYFSSQKPSGPSCLRCLRQGWEMHRKQGLETAWAARAGQGAAGETASPGRSTKVSEGTENGGKGPQGRKEWEEGQGSWEGQGSKISRPLFSAGNESAGFSLPASGIQSYIPAFLQLLGPTLA